jgi:PAS domain S-box-containing protein
MKMIFEHEILNANILIVDDQHANVLLLAEILREAGYACVTSTTDPYAVCELHRKNNYDLILLDLLMPDMDGFQVMDGLKKIDKGDYLPVLAITAQPNHKLRALAVGAKDFIAKPFDLLEVQLRIHNLLEVRLLYRKLEEYNKLLELTVLNRTARLNSIFNASVEGIITVDMSDTIVSANVAVETIFGYKPEELVGCGFNKIMSSTLREMNDCNLTAEIKFDGQIKEVEGIHKNGSVVPLDLSIAEFSIDDARFFTTIVRDVSLRKYREQQDKEHLDQLAHVTRLGLMGEMASGIAHEVNQPLSAITNYTQVSLNLINKESPDLVKLAEVAVKTQEQALRAGHIIHRMKQFCKSKSQQRSATDINELINDSVNLCADSLKKNSVKLVLELDSDLPLINVDHIQIQQVLINLICNSIDAILGASKNKLGQVNIQSHLTPDNEIQVCVKDNGPGIKDDQQPKILMPFHTTKADGMGMGLSICRSLIEAHNGTLYFNSRFGKGSAFYFTLPI